MAIRIKIDLDFGQSIWLKNDPDQEEYILSRVLISPGNQIKFELSYLGSTVEVYDFEISTEPDKLKMLKSKENGEDDD